MELLDTLNPFWDENILDLISGIKDALPDSPIAGVARSIAALLSLIYLSVRAYAMIVGEGKLEVMQLFRPFIITMVIINFGLYASLVNTPGKAAGNSAKTQFQANAIATQELYEQKVKLVDNLFDVVLENTNEIRKLYYDADGDNSTWSDVKNFASLGTREALLNMQASITVYEKLFWIKISIWLQNFIMWIVMGIFKGVCYCIFFIELILLHILLILGPISFAFSIAGAFKDSWVTWTARYISVTFYTCIGFIVLNIAIAIIMYGLHQEVNRLEQIIALKDYKEMFIQAVNRTDNFIGFLLIAIVVAIAGIVSVPVITTWIIQTAGAGSAFFGTAVNTARAGLRTGTTLIKS
ncbi:hypothetical protein ACLOAU_04530 [Niabella sp. CJ426]|uniref:hypothetical protein n=1 Tax=Niabella sp. CJ426 TaxID=3393740 RepID=UPI003D03F1CE